MCLSQKNIIARVPVSNTGIKTILCPFLGLKPPQTVVELPIHKFKAHIKSTLMKKGYYKVDDYLKDKNVWDALLPSSHNSPVNKAL